MNEEHAPKPTLGHGNHWEAIFPDWYDRIPDFLPWLVKTAQPAAKFSAPWPAPGYADILRFSHAIDTDPLLELTVLLGVWPADKTTRFLSTYLTLLEARVWHLPVERVSDIYGPFEGVVELTVPSGATLRCFDPHFGENRSAWKTGATQTVLLAALALRVEPYEANPIRITEGPLLEDQRQCLRAEGKPDEAAALDHVMVFTDQLRTLYSGEAHDHSAFVGRIERVRKLPAHDPLPAGWLLDVELMSDEGQPAHERIMPVYTFAAALDDYRPRQGDLVQGTLWVQATPATP